MVKEQHLDRSVNGALTQVERLITEHGPELKDWKLKKIRGLLKQMPDHYGAIEFPERPYAKPGYEIPIKTSTLPPLCVAQAMAAVFAFEHGRPEDFDPNAGMIHFQLHRFAAGCETWMASAAKRPGNKIRNLGDLLTYRLRNVTNLQDNICRVPIPRWDQK